MESPNFFLENCMESPNFFLENCMESPNFVSLHHNLVHENQGVIFVSEKMLPLQRYNTQKDEKDS